MKRIAEAVVHQIKNQREHEDVLELWEKLWSHFKRDGDAGAEQFLNGLLEDPDRREEEDEK